MIVYVPNIISESIFASLLEHSFFVVTSALALLAFRFLI